MIVIGMKQITNDEDVRVITDNNNTTTHMRVQSHLEKKPMYEHVTCINAHFSQQKVEMIYICVKRDHHSFVCS